MPALYADRRIRLLGLAARHGGGRRENRRRQGDDHEGPRALSDEREPRGFPFVFAPGAGGNPLWLTDAVKRRISARLLRPFCCSAITSQSSARGMSSFSAHEAE